MKKLIMGLVTWSAVLASSLAGPLESNYAERSTPDRPNDEFYRDREWNFDLFGTYAFTNEPYRDDRYLGVDHAYGGGLNVGYMFTRYLGVGLEGYALAGDDVIGQASGNLIFRYPVPGTRVAPYGFAGGGVIFNGSQIEELVDRGAGFDRVRRHSEAEGTAQFGAGIEVRLTPNLGLIHDFSWNVVQGDQNDFGLLRSGVRFAF